MELFDSIKLVHTSLMFVYDANQEYYSFYAYQKRLEKVYDNSHGTVSIPPEDLYHKLYTNKTKNLNGFHMNVRVHFILSRIMLLKLRDEEKFSMAGQDIDFAVLLSGLVNATFIYKITYFKRVVDLNCDQWKQLEEGLAIYTNITQKALVVDTFHRRFHMHFLRIKQDLL